MWFSATSHFRVRQLPVSVPTPLYLFFKTIKEMKAYKFQNTDTHTHQETQHEVFINIILATWYVFWVKYSTNIITYDLQNDISFMWSAGNFAIIYCSCVINLWKWFKPYFHCYKNGIKCPHVQWVCHPRHRENCGPNIGIASSQAVAVSS